MVTTASGNKAEIAVAGFMQEQGYKIVGLNWKTRLCEIDVIARREDIVYFVEVKYRTDSQQGSGLEHITTKKLNQIKFAVRVWCHNNDWEGDCRILGAEVFGLDFEHINLVEIE